jgi:hypothetical protein
MALEGLKRKLLDAEAKDLAEKLMLKIDELTQEVKRMNAKLDRIIELLEVRKVGSGERGEEKLREKYRA